MQFFVVHRLVILYVQTITDAQFGHFSHHDINRSFAVVATPLAPRTSIHFPCHVASTAKLASPRLALYTSRIFRKFRQTSLALVLLQQFNNLTRLSITVLLLFYFSTHSDQGLGRLRRSPLCVLTRYTYID